MLSLKNLSAPSYAARHSPVTGLRARIFAASRVGDLGKMPQHDGRGHHRLGQEAVAIKL